MPSFSDLPLRSFIDALGSPTPTPGGGTAAAIAGAMGTGLLVMVAGLARTRSGTDDEKAELASAREQLLPLIHAFQSAADRDAEAFDAVMAAFRLPKATDEEKAARKAAVQHAYRGATEVPLETLRLAVTALDAATTVGRHGAVAAASDVGVAAGLLQAAADGAAANVRINLGSLKDEAYRTETELETAGLVVRAVSGAAQVRELIAAPTA